ncbi:hypothetical protein ACIHQR_17130 [Corallococcus coralloides]|uniref:hypothetical protein n=1 Tax=Corallococcus coralloides TaxID=184914 RepID=UPI003850ED02
MAELEDTLGSRLIQRASRSFTLTDVGRDFLDHARAALTEAEAAENVVRHRGAIRHRRAQSLLPLARPGPG